MPFCLGRMKRMTSLSSRRSYRTSQLLHSTLRLELAKSVGTYGFPLSGLLSSSGNFTLGSVTSLAGPNDDTRVLQISTPVQPGNSGGPLLDMSGSVIGVVEYQLNALLMIKVTGNVPQNVNFAIQSPIVVNFLRTKGISPSLAEAERKTLDPPEVADLAKAFAVQIICQSIEPPQSGPSSADGPSRPLHLSPCSWRVRLARGLSGSTRTAKCQANHTF